MSEDHASQARFQLSTGQMIGIAMLMGLVGGLCTLAAGAVARSVVAPFRQQLEQMEAPARGGVRRSRPAAGPGAWRDGRPVAQTQPL